MDKPAPYPQHSVLPAALQAYRTAGSRDAQQSQVDALLLAWSATSDHRISLQTSTALAPGGAETAVAKWARLNPVAYQKIAILSRQSRNQTGNTMAAEPMAR